MYMNHNHYYFPQFKKKKNIKSQNYKNVFGQNLIEDILRERYKSVRIKSSENYTNLAGGFSRKLK